MAGFKVHAAIAFAISLSATSYGFALNHFPLPWGAALCTLGVVGGLLPDIDSGEAKMARYSGLLIGAITSLFTYMLLSNLIIALLLFVPCAKVAHYLINQCTTHRGVFHSIPMGLLLSIGTFYLATLLGLPEFFSLYSAGFLGGGYFVHLILDEIWSLRKGVSKHCSFGTALQFFRFTFWKSFAATYALLAVAIYNTPLLKNWIQRGF